MPSSRSACRAQFRIVWADGSNFFARASGVCPDRTSSIRRARNSSGYGAGGAGFFGTVATSDPKGQPGQLQCLRTGLLREAADGSRDSSTAAARELSQRVPDPGTPAPLAGSDGGDRKGDQRDCSRVPPHSTVELATTLRSFDLPSHDRRGSVPHGHPGMLIPGPPERYMASHSTRQDADGLHIQVGVLVTPSVDW